MMRSPGFFASFLIGFILMALLVLNMVLVIIASVKAERGKILSLSIYDPAD